MTPNDQPSAAQSIQVKVAPEITDGSRPEFDWFANSSKYREQDGLVNRFLSQFGLRILRDSTLGQKSKRERWGNHAAELHHHVYGRPWFCGRDDFEMLRARGLKPTDTVLDFGCGSMRTGIWTAGFLESDKYFGVDAHRASLDAAADYEIPLHGLEPKKPQLLHSSEFRVDQFGVKFDVIFVASVFSHLTEAQQINALDRIQSCSKSGSRMYVYHSDLPLDEKRLAERGIKLTERFEVASKFYDKPTQWFELLFD